MEIQEGVGQARCQCSQSVETRSIMISHTHDTQKFGPGTDFHYYNRNTLQNIA